MNRYYELQKQQQEFIQAQQTTNYLNFLHTVQPCLTAPNLPYSAFDNVPNHFMLGSGTNNARLCIDAAKQNASSNLTPNEFVDKNTESQTSSNIQVDSPASSAVYYKEDRPIPFNHELNIEQPQNNWLNLQMNTALPGNGPKYRCKLCCKRFFKLDSYKEHMIKLHSVVLPYQCDICGNGYCTRKSIRKHFCEHRRAKKVNFNGGILKCPICQKCCQNLSHHMKIHSGIRNHICDICNATFKTKSNLIGHMPIHINARQFKCPLCPKDFNFKTQLNRHIRIHSTTCPFVCEMCGTGFKFSGSLRVHMRSHTGEKPYQCNRCEKSFTTSVSLRLHTRVHTGEKPYKCDICQRGFTDGSTMKIHKRIHTGENPYICHLCGKTTKQASNLKSHYRHYHKITDITSKNIRANARIFEKHRHEIFAHSDYLEILSRAATEKIPSTIVEPPQIPLDELLASINSNKKNDVEEKAVSPTEKKSRSRKYIAKQERIEAEQYELRRLFESDDSNSSMIDLAGSRQISDVKPFTTQSSNEPGSESINHDTQVFIKSEFDCNSESASTPPTADSNVIVKQEIYDDESNQNDEDELILPDNNAINTLTKITIKHKSKSRKGHTIKPEIEELTIDVSKVKCENESVDDFNWFSNDDNFIKYEQKEIKMKKKGQPKKVVKKSKSTIVLDNQMVNDTPIKLKKEENDDNEIVTAAVTDVAKSTKSSSKFQKCTICSHKYLNHEEHMRTHTMERPFECDICHKSFKLKDYMKVHRKLHSEEKNVICDQCGAAFYYNTDLRRHYRTHTNDRPYKCDLCGHSFKENSGLRIHMRSHSGEKPYKCNVCEKSFSTTMGQKLHIRTHTGEKPYKCEYCPSVFADNSTFRQHVRIHTGERPYKCHICGKGTTQAGNLKSHYRHYHKLIVKNVVKTVNNSSLATISKT